MTVSQSRRGGGGDVGWENIWKTQGGALISLTYTYIFYGKIQRFLSNSAKTKQLARQGIEQNFAPQTLNRRDDLCLAFCFHHSTMTPIVCSRIFLVPLSPQG